jgi:hypothetical protein
MFSRPMLFFGVLLAAVVVPYVLLDEHLAQSVRGGWNRLLGKVEEERESLLERFNQADYSPVSGAAAAGPPVTIEQAFRFDLTPQWVSNRWPRVSTVLGEPEQLGMRVALVSGTRPDDVAGSLTYYFDQHHQLQRITFEGLTRDPRRLLSAVVTPYGLKSQPTTGAAHYIAGNPDDPTSEVFVDHLPVLTSDPEAARAEVSVDLRRRDTRTGRLGRQAANDDPEPKILPSTYRRW